MDKRKTASIALGITGGLVFSLAGWAVSFVLARTSLWAVSLFAALLLPLAGLGILSVTAERKELFSRNPAVISFVAASFAVEAAFFLIASVSA